MQIQSAAKDTVQTKTHYCLILFWQLDPSISTKAIFFHLFPKIYIASAGCMHCTFASKAKKKKRERERETGNKTNKEMLYSGEISVGNPNPSSFEKLCQSQLNCAASSCVSTLIKLKRSLIDLQHPLALKRYIVNCLATLHSHCCHRVVWNCRQLFYEIKL